MRVNLWISSHLELESQLASPLAKRHKETTGSELQPRGRLTAWPGVLISLLPDLTTKLDQASQQGTSPTSRLAVRLGTLSLLPRVTAFPQVAACK